MQHMQTSQGPTRPLLTALEVQALLNIDRSTVYRMAEDGRLPAIRVGRSWRFPADRIESLLDAGASVSTTPPGPPAAESTPRHGDLDLPDLPAGPPPLPGTGPEAKDPKEPGDGELALDTAIAAAVVTVASDLLGVMMVVTDMHGRPVTDVANPSAWYSAHADEPDVLDACVAEWRDLADHPDLTPRFQVGALGFQCARAFIRSGSTLVGMVLAGGVSPATDRAVDPDQYHLDAADRDRVLTALPQVAAAISTPAPRPAATTTPAPDPVADTKEN